MTEREIVNPLVSVRSNVNNSQASDATSVFLGSLVVRFLGAPSEDGREMRCTRILWCLLISLPPVKRGQGRFLSRHRANAGIDAENNVTTDVLVLSLTLAAALMKVFQHEERIQGCNQIDNQTAEFVDKDHLFLLPSLYVTRFISGVRKVLE